jgi:DNA-binding GntR family transcriptional regulator
MTFQAIESQSTAELLAEQIRDAILVGKLQPGDRLIEQELSESFKTSRGPIREAIRILATEGLVEHRKNRGAVVSAPNFDDVLEVYAMRMSLGSIAVTHASQLSSETQLDLREVSKKLEAMRNFVGGNLNRMISLDLDFQSALIALGELPRITEMFEQTAVDIGVFVRFLGIKYDDSDHKALITRHEKLLKAIGSGDATRAVAIWNGHIQVSVREFMKPFSEIEIQELFERPLMKNLFEMENVK